MTTQPQHGARVHGALLIKNKKKTNKGGVAPRPYALHRKPDARGLTRYQSFENSHPVGAQWPRLHNVAKTANGSIM